MTRKDLNSLLYSLLKILGLITFLKIITLFNFQIISIPYVYIKGQEISYLQEHGFSFQNVYFQSDAA